MIISDKPLLPVVNPNSYQNETRIGFYGIIGGIWALVACYAVLHDQYHEKQVANSWLKP